MNHEAEIESFLRGLRGCMNIGFTARTEPKLLKKSKDGQPCPFVGIEKVSRVQGMVGFDYEHSCRKEQVRQGEEANYDAGSGWGQHETSALIEHKGKKYMQVKINQSRPRYYVRGVKVPSSRIAPFLPKRGDSLVAMARYSLSRIEELRCGKVAIGNTEDN
jgi:hypothetical protein